MHYNLYDIDDNIMITVLQIFFDIGYHGFTVISPNPILQFTVVMAELGCYHYCNMFYVFKFLYQPALII